MAITVDIPDHAFTPLRDQIMDDLLLAPPARSHPRIPAPAPLFDHLNAPLDALIISDLHLGSDNCQAKLLCNLLDSVLDGTLPVSRLIINGDVFDSIDFRRLKKNHWKVLSLIRHLSDKIEVVWIAGNHDGAADIVSHLLGVQVVDEFIFSSGKRRFLCIHGHRFDDFIDDHPILTWLADLGYWLLQKIDRTHYVARLAKKKSKVFVHCVGKIQAGATRLARENNCHAAICGHTHLAQHLPAQSPDDIDYYNSGCWTESPCTYLTLHNGTVTLHHAKSPAGALTGI